MSGLVCCTRIATAQLYDGSRVRELNLGTQAARVLCGSPDDSMFHRICDCPSIPAPFDLDKTERIVDEARENAHSCPVFWFRGLPPSDWYPELPVADDPFVDDFGSLDIMGGHAFTDGSGGTETKDPAVVVVAMVSRGSSPTVACLTRLEEKQAFCMAGNIRWQEPNSSQQLKPFSCDEKAAQQVII